MNIENYVSTSEDSLRNKKLDSYECRYKDFAAEKELTVTITLNEYRELVADAAKAKYEYDKLCRDKYEMQCELEKKIAYLEEGLNEKISKEENRND